MRILPNYLLCRYYYGSHHVPGMKHHWGKVSVTQSIIEFGCMLDKYVTPCYYIVVAGITFPCRTRREWDGVTGMNNGMTYDPMLGIGLGQGGNVLCPSYPEEMRVQIPLSLSPDKRR